VVNDPASGWMLTTRTAGSPVSKKISSPFSRDDRRAGHFNYFFGLVQPITGSGSRKRPQEKPNWRKAYDWRRLTPKA